MIQVHDGKEQRMLFEAKMLKDERGWRGGREKKRKWKEKELSAL